MRQYPYIEGWKVKFVLTFLLLLPLLTACPKREVLDEVAPLRSSEQLVLIIMGGWDDPAGTVSWYERRSTHQDWSVVEQGRVAKTTHGLGWGRGLHTGRIRPGPVTLEGDGRAVAGAFRLNAVFGTPSTRPSVRFPYMRIHERIVCVTDPESRRYNKIIDIDHVDDPDWKSTVLLPEATGAVVEHNLGDLFVKGSGSCSLLHAHVDNPNPTSVTVDADAMEALALWLDPAKYPVLVQLPQEEATRLATSWNLPVEGPE